MHALILNGAVEKYPYTIGNLRKDNPQISFPRSPSDDLLVTYNVLPVTRTDRPDHDPITEDVAEQPPEMIDGAWVQVWAVTPAEPEEIERRRAEAIEMIREQRADAYRTEADPLFFKAQRGEGDIEDWEAAVADIRARFPYPAAAD
jgi:hypothetical protein